MREIELSQGKIALVDDVDFEWLSQWKWHAQKGRRTFYARRAIRLRRGKQAFVDMHRSILEALPGVFVDHINGDGLDNRRENLRLATKRENGWNRRISRNNTSGYKGVSWFERDKNWTAHIRVYGKLIHLGYFATAEDAARSYDESARLHFGEFARLNFND